MAFLIWFIFGVLAGIITNLVAPERKFSDFLQTVILSVLGSILGGFMANLLFGSPLGSFSLLSLSIALGGSLVLIIGPRFFAKRD